MIGVVASLVTAFALRLGDYTPVPIPVPPLPAPTPGLLDAEASAYLESLPAAYRQVAKEIATSKAPVGRIALYERVVKIQQLKAGKEWGLALDRQLRPTCDKLGLQIRDSQAASAVLNSAAESLETRLGGNPGPEPPGPGPKPRPPWLPPNPPPAPEPTPDPMRN